MSLMTNYRFFYLISICLMLHFPLFSLSRSSHESLKVACIGDSLTYGYGLLSREQNSYPAQLSRLLPSGYDLRNFGINGACANQDRKDYYLSRNGQEIIDWDPDILIIMLGSNDSKEYNWQTGAKYLEGMKSIIRALNAEKKSEVILMTPPPCRLNPYGIRDSVIREEIIPALENLSRECGFSLINLYDPLKQEENIYYDNIHLNKKGYSRMTEEILPYLIK